MSFAVTTLELRQENDLLIARQRARQIANRLGFDGQDQTRIATAVSELARNALRYAAGGRIDFQVAAAENLFEVVVRDAGPGIPGQDPFADAAQGSGLVGAKRLMDTFQLATGAGGTTITAGKYIPRSGPPVDARLAGLAFEPANQGSSELYAELAHQNKELMRALEEVREQKTKLAQLNRELEETNRGVVALYAELDEKAASLERATATKTRFFSNMTHEFRTPLYSIKNLTWLLLNGADGPLTDEQRLQVEYIRRSAEDLSGLVNDLLDLAKVEAGKITVHPAPFSLAETLGGLRGVLKPLSASNAEVELVIEDVQGSPEMFSDEGKLVQILRNLISNALKYTKRGEVRVTSKIQDGRLVAAVSDTGIGIARDQFERIFEEFSQIESPLQKKSKGTGLGLPLSQKLASLLGGEITLESEEGKGSTFTLTVPCRIAMLPALASEGARFTVAVVDDDDSSRYLLRSMLARLPVKLIEASGGNDGLRIIRDAKPKYVFLDLLMPDMSGFDVLTALRADPATRDVPVALRTTKMLDAQEQARLAALNAAWLPKNEDFEKEHAQIRALLTQAGILHTHTKVGT